MESRLALFLLVTGILIGVVTITSVSIRKHQKEWINGQFNRLSRWLDAKKPLRYTTSHKGRNMILWWSYVIGWDVKLLQNGIRNDNLSLIVLAIVLFLVWLATFRWATEPFGPIKVKEPKFRLKLFTNLRSSVHNFFLRRYQIYISRIMLSESSAGYVFRSIVYELVVFPVSLVVVLAPFIYLAILILTVLSLISAGNPTEPDQITFQITFQIGGIIASLVGAVILILFWRTLWFLFLINLEAQVIFWSALLVLLVAIFHLMVKVLGQFIGAWAENEKGAWAAIIVVILAVLAVIAAYLQYSATVLK